MATFEQRIDSEKNQTIRVKVRRKGFPTQSATFKRMTDAKKWATKIEAELDEGRHFGRTESKRHTVAELLDRYTREVLAKSPTKAVNQSRQLQWWKKEIGPYRLSDVTPALITQCREKLASEGTQYRKSRAGSTVNRYLALLSHAFSIAVREWEWLDQNPMLKVRKLQEPRGRIRFLSDDERPRLLQACRESDNTALETIVVLALSTGMRKAEILNLTWADVDLRRGSLVIHNTKNKHRRSVPLAGPALALLQQKANVIRIDTQLVFPSPIASRPIDIRSAWEAALQRAGVADFRFHDLRHSAASYLAMNGATLAEIAEVLGHRTLSMVRRYAHFCDTHTAGVVARMNEKIFA